MAKTASGKTAKRKTAVIDFETDPFFFDRVPEPFCCEFLAEDGTEMVFWGPDCAEDLCDWLETVEQPYLIYAHNGGKFDFHFMHKYLDNPALIIKTRIVEAKLWHHTLRDSFAILPVPLRAYKKDDIDYSKMEREVRDANRVEILDYLHSDCVYLLELVTRFIQMFGPQMTIGGTAMREIQKLHKFQRQGSKHDATFRQFYFGGRVQVFKAGIQPGPWRLYDVNSMYPSVMRNSKHPINGRFDWTSKLPNGFERPYFCIFEGRQLNALPSVAEDGSLTFQRSSGTFHACSHELEVALEHNLVQIDKVIDCYVSTDSITFEEFVDKFFNLRLEAKAISDAALDLFYKLILNSGYGRTAINPHGFEDWHIHRDFGNDTDLEAKGYSLAADHECIELWSKSADIKEADFCDVAIGASITSSARATLLRGLQSASEPIYCDTDSIICRDFRGDMDDKRLGAWKLESVSEYAAIAGKKLFTLYNSEQDERPIKLSSKGGTLSMAQLIAMCRGETITQSRDAPTFSLKNDPKFITRRFKMTA